MKKYETLNVNQDGNVVTVQLHRPKSRNAINMQMVYDLMDVVEILSDASDVDVLVLRGSEGNFCSGIDLRDFSLDKPPDIHGLQKWETMCRQLETLNKFTVAAVEGDCVGGGFQLVLLCDARIAESKAVFQFNEVKRGFLPGMATFRFAKYVGLGRAKNIILTGKRLNANQALEWGVLDEVCEKMMFETTTEKIINELLPFYPDALELARRLILESYATDYENFVGHFLAAQHRAINSEAFKQLILKETSPKKMKNALDTSSS